MSTVVLRNTKGSPLTFTEVDNNFSNLNTDKYQTGDSPTFATTVITQIMTISGTASPTLAASYGSSIALTVGNTGSTSRIIFGDGSGWKFQFSKRVASVTTDLIAITDSGTVFTVNGAATIVGQFNGAAGGQAALVVNSDAVTHYSAFNVRQAGANTAFFGNDGTQALIADSTNSDCIIRSESGSIRMSIGGAATHFRVTSTNAFLFDGNPAGYRNIPRSTTTTTATTADLGKMIAITAAITIPNATFAAGDVLSIYNDSAGALNVTQGASLTLRKRGTATTGTLSLASRGVATVWFNSSSEGICGGDV